MSDWPLSCVERDKNDMIERVVELLFKQGINLSAVQGHCDKTVSKGLDAESLAIGDLAEQFPAAQLIIYSGQYECHPDS